MSLTPLEIADIAVKTLDSKKGMDIKLLKIADLTVIAEYFIICTGTSNTHLSTLSEEVERVLKENGELPHHVEGYRNGSWVLLDYGCVVIHLFDEEARKFYSLERIWKDAEDIPLSL